MVAAQPTLRACAADGKPTPRGHLYMTGINISTRIGGWRVRRFPDRKMDKKTTIRALQIAALIALPVLLAAHSNVPPAGYAGVPGENGTCTSCDRITAPTGNVRVTLPGAATCTAGAPQPLQAVVSDAVASRWEFKVPARLAGNTATQAG